MQSQHRQLLRQQPASTTGVFMHHAQPQTSRRPTSAACAYQQRGSTLPQVSCSHRHAHNHSMRIRHVCRTAASPVSSTPASSAPASSTPPASSSSPENGTASPSTVISQPAVGAAGTETSPWCDITLDGTETAQEIHLRLQQGSSQKLPLSPATVTALQTALSPTALASLSNTELAALLLSVSAASRQPPSTTWLTATLDHVLSRVMLGMSDDDMPHLAGLLWAVSELGATPTDKWLQAAAERLKGGVASGGLFATDLCTILCALGAMGYKPNTAMTSMIVKETELQLKEFLSDFSPRDVARLASGLADLGVAQAFPTDFNRQLMKAVYSKVRTIEDKAEVDFALNKLETDNKSMHYDPRWTHEELSWLPRRERDKRRILSEGFVKSQWGGFNPGKDS